MEIATLLLLGVLPCLVIIAGIHDLTSMRIPNWIPGLLVLTFFPIAFVAGLSPLTVLMHLGVGLAALLIGMAMFALRWLGGGDAKLMAGVALWLGLSASGVFVLSTAVFGGLLTLMLMAARSHIAPFVPTGPAWVGQLMQPRGDIPYGVAIAAGALMAYPVSPFLAAAS